VHTPGTALIKSPPRNIWVPLCLKRDPDFYRAPFSDGTLLSAAGSWGGIPNVQNETIAIFWRRNLDTVLIREHYNRILPVGDSLCVRLVKR